MNIEKYSSKERHKYNDISDSNDDCCDWLPVVDAGIVVYNDDTWELEYEQRSTKRVH